MNIGFYVDTLEGKGATNVAYATLNRWVEGELCSNASLFYTDIGYNPVVPKFALFNSTDVWNFTGNIILTSIASVASVDKAINKFKSLFFYDSQSQVDGFSNVMALIDIFNRVPFVVQRSEDFDYIKRITGKSPHFIKDPTPENLKDIFK